MMKNKTIIIDDNFIPSSHPLFLLFLPVINPPTNKEIININI